jgi:FkbM family methyltransferase
MINFSGVPRSAILGKIIRLPLRLIPENQPVPILQGKLRGKLWIAGSHNHGCWLGSYELTKQELFCSMVKPGSVIFDIGANVGFYSLLASVLTGSTGHVFAFEPLPRNLSLLRRHIALNKSDNITVIDAAVARESGSTRFMNGNPASSGICENGELTVRTVALDDINLPKPARVDLLKIDVEGAELSVLQGGRRLIKAYKPAILLATHGTKVQRDCREFLADLNYRVGSVNGSPVERTDELIAKP